MGRLEDKATSASRTVTRPWGRTGAVIVSDVDVWLSSHVRKQHHPAPERNNNFFFTSLPFVCDNSFCIFHMVSAIYPLEILPSKQFFPFSSARLRFFSHSCVFQHSIGNGNTASVHLPQHTEAWGQACWGLATQQAGSDQPTATRQVQGLARVPGAWLGNGLLLAAAQLRPGHQARVWAKKQLSRPREGFLYSSVSQLHCFDRSLIQN